MAKLNGRRKHADTSDPPFKMPYWPAERVEMWKIDRIRPYPRNARTHPAEEITQLAADMIADGVTMPILVDEEGEIIAGHARRLAALENKFAQYPVVVARGWTQKQKMAARIKDNQRTLQGGWDLPMLKLDLEELRLADFDMPLLGFPELELNDYLGLVPAGSMPVLNVSLADRFGVVPFSVLNAREGWWQTRKMAWLALGIQSEVGRGTNLLRFSDAVALDGQTYKNRAEARRKNGDGK